MSKACNSSCLDDLLRIIDKCSCLLFFSFSVFKAVNIPEHRVAACKFIALTEETTETERKTVEKEMRVHAALKHEHVLEFLNAVIVDLKHKQTYIPGIYMLLEFAGGGDLFDKIGMLTCIFRKGTYYESFFFALGNVSSRYWR